MSSCISSLCAFFIKSVSSCCFSISFWKESLEPSSVDSLLSLNSRKFFCNWFISLVRAWCALPSFSFCSVTDCKLDSRTEFVSFTISKLTRLFSHSFVFSFSKTAEISRFCFKVPIKISSWFTFAVFSASWTFKFLISSTSLISFCLDCSKSVILLVSWTFIMSDDSPISAIWFCKSSDSWRNFSVSAM